MNGKDKKHFSIHKFFLRLFNTMKVVSSFKTKFKQPLTALPMTCLLMRFLPPLRLRRAGGRNDKKYFERSEESILS